MVSREPRWAKLGLLGAELIVVVVGVIIALGLEALWSARVDEDRAEEHLLALQSEFVTNLDSLNGNIARMEEIRGAAASLLDVIVGGRPEPTADSLVLLTWDAFSFPPYEPYTVAYDNLISSGDIALLKDAQLNRDLALFLSQVEHYRTGEWQLDQWNRVIQQFVSSEMSPLDWLTPDFRKETGVPEPVVRTDWESVLANRAFEGILVNRVIAASDNLMVLNRVLPPAERIVRRLAELLLGTT